MRFVYEIWVESNLWPGSHDQHIPPRELSRFYWIIGSSSFFFLSNDYCIQICIHFLSECGVSLVIYVVSEGRRGELRCVACVCGSIISQTSRSFSSFNRIILKNDIQTTYVFNQTLSSIRPYHACNDTYQRPGPAFNSTSSRAPLGVKGRDGWSSD